jgi:hypothetical protein
VLFEFDVLVLLESNEFPEIVDVLELVFVLVLFELTELPLVVSVDGLFDPRVLPFASRVLPPDTPTLGAADAALIMATKIAAVITEPERSFFMT